jgi:ActR/RegA family two-component response regulator
LQGVSTMTSRNSRILLVVHDDISVIRQIIKMSSEHAEVMRVQDSIRAEALVDSQQPIHAMIVGRCGSNPIDLLAHIRIQRPEIRTMLLADPTDLSASITALHDGVVDHVLNPPLREAELIAILSQPAPRRAITIPPEITIMPAARKHA